MCRKGKQQAFRPAVGSQAPQGLVGRVAAAQRRASRPAATEDSREGRPGLEDSREGRLGRLGLEDVIPVSC